MAQTRYERLNNSQEDENRTDMQRSNFKRRYDIHDNEEIELGNEYSHENGEHTDDGRSQPTDDSSINPNLSITTNISHLNGSRLMQMAIGSLTTILLYLTLSICLTFYQKTLIQKMKFPLTIVSYHLVIKLFLSALVRSIYKCRNGKTRVQLDWRTSLRKMAPSGIASGIDIGFSNWGLELVPISLYTMTKSSTIVFILFFAIMLGLEKKSWSLVFIVGLIAIGLFMFTYKSTQFDALGFIFILVASLSSGIRWSFAQFVMQKSKLGLHNPIDMIYQMQPWMIASILPFAVTIEGQKIFDIFMDISSIPNSDIGYTILKVSLGAVLAFFMEISEFLVLSQTSSLTLSIAGIFKDICQLVLAVEIYDDQLSLVNVFGLIVCLAGICLHLIHKYSTLLKMDEFNTLNDDLQYHETSINANGGGMVAIGNNATMTIHNKQHSAQTIPLLEQTDSDDSNNDNEQEASDVIFDVLKRRDMQR